MTSKATQIVSTDSATHPHRTAPQPSAQTSGTDSCVDVKPPTESAHAPSASRKPFWRNRRQSKPVRALYSRALADSSAERKWWRASLGVSSALLMLTVGALLLVQPIREGRLEHDYNRSLSVAEAGDIRFQQIGWQSFVSNTADGVPIYGAGIAPLSKESPIPRGLPRWPEPGEVFVSPEIREIDGGIEAASFYGRVTETIQRDGLITAQEPLIYVGISNQYVEENELQPLYQAPAETSQDTYAKYKQQQAIQLLSESEEHANYTSGFTGAALGYDLPNNFIFGIAFLLVVPAGVGALVVLKLDCERRLQRLQALRLVGAQSHTLAAIVLQEVRLPILGGVLTGLGLLALSSTMDWVLPIFNFEILGRDLFRGTAPVLAGALGVVAFLLLSAVITYCRPQGRTLGAGPTLAPKVPLAWPVWVGISAIVLCNVLVAVFATTRDDDLILLSYLVMAGVLMALGGKILGYLLYKISAIGVRRAKKTSDAAALISHRFTGFAPAPLIRISTGLVVVTFVACLSFMLGQRNDPEVQEALAYMEEVNGKIVEINGSLTAEQLAALEAALPQHQVLLALGLPDSSFKFATVSGSCSTLESAFGSCGGKTRNVDATLSRVFSAPLSLQGVALLDVASSKKAAEEATGEVSGAVSGETTGAASGEDGSSTSSVLTTDQEFPHYTRILVAAQDREGVDIPVVQEALRATTGDPLVTATAVGQQNFSTSKMNADRINYINGLGVVGTCIALYVALTACAFEVLRVARLIAPLQVLIHSRALFSRLALGLIGAPVLLASLVGAIFALGVSAVELASGDLTLPYSTFAILGVLVVLLTALLVATTARSMAKSSTVIRH